jgi:hypothetical protein
VLCVTLLVTALMLLAGSSATAIFHSLFVLPMQHADWIEKSKGVAPGGGLPALAGLVTFVAYRLLVRSGLPVRAPGTLVVPALKCAFGIATLVLATRSQDLIGFLAPFLWLVVIPLREGDRELASYLPRLILAACAALQTLYVFPLAGSQTAFASVLILPCGVVALHDGLMAFRRLAPIQPTRSMCWVAAFPLCVALVAAYAVVGQRAQLAYQRRIPLALPGTDGVRLPERQGATYHWLSHNLAAHCDTFLGAPGMNSLYFWADLPAPSLLSNDRWFLTFGEDQQRSMMAGLAAYDRPCAIRNGASLLGWLALKQGPAASMPLLDYMGAEFESVGAVGGWELMVEKGRPVGDLTYSASMGPATQASEISETDAVISISLPASIAARVDRVSVVDLSRRAVVADTRSGSAALEVLAATGSWPIFPHASSVPGERTAQPSRLTLLAREAHGALTSTASIVARAYDAEGRHLASVPFLR